jgi:molybdopterin/thiamine biosynthesis adenylyltransferase
MNNTKYTLAPYLRIRFDGEKVSFGFGSIQQFFYEHKIYDPLIKMAGLFLNNSLHLITAKTKFLEKYSFQETEANHAIEVLKNGHFLIEENIFDKEERYSRYLLFYAMSGADYKNAQKKLKDKHVVIVGCGGIGNIVGIQLATAGIGKLTLIDFDFIEISNLTRQIAFQEKHINFQKTEILAAELKKRNSKIEINIINKEIQRERQMYPLADLIVISADAPNLMIESNKFCVKNNIPCINVGYVQDIAIWGPLVIPGETACFSCTQFVPTPKIGTELDDIMVKINSNFQTPSSGPVNMLAGALASLDILKFLVKFGEIYSLNARVGLWTHNLKFEKQITTRNPKCEVCGELHVNQS